MKRILFLFALFATVFSLTACGGPKEVITAEEFINFMEARGYTVENYTDLQGADSAIETLLVAETGDFWVEFIVLETENQARSLYNNIRSDFEANSGNVVTRRFSAEVSNFARFRQTTAGRFEAIARVENTIMLTVSDAEHRDKVEALFEAIGYFR